MKRSAPNDDDYDSIVRTVMRHVGPNLPQYRIELAKAEIRKAEKEIQLGELEKEIERLKKFITAAEQAQLFIR